MSKIPTRRSTYRRPDPTLGEQTAVVLALTLAAVVIATSMLMGVGAW